MYLLCISCKYLMNRIETHEDIQKRNLIVFFDLIETDEDGDCTIIEYENYTCMIS